MFVFTIRMQTKFKIAQYYIVGIQIKLVHKIFSQDLKPLVGNCCGSGVLMGSLVFICMCMYS